MSPIRKADGRHCDVTNDVSIHCGNLGDDKRSRAAKSIHNELLGMLGMRGVQERPLCRAMYGVHIGGAFVAYLDVQADTSKEY